jgi:hypothetical protein
MNNVQKMILLFAVTIPLAACGGSNSTSPLSTDKPATITGLVQQGNITGASVFVDLNGNGVKDVGEPAAAAATGADGKFTLSLTAEQVTAMKAAGAKAKIVSAGGTDTTTGLAAGLLATDPPAVTGDTATKNITPMTTLTAMAADDSQKGSLKTKMGELGHKDSSGKGTDDAEIEHATPAVIALCKSVEAALMNVQKAAAASGKGADVTTAVTHAAAAEIGKALAGKTAAELTDTQKLADTISAAVGTALTANKTQLGITDAQVTTMVASIDTGCKAVADAVKNSTGGSLSTEDHSKTESEIMHSAGTDIKNSVDSSSAQVETETHGGGK